MLIMLLHFTGCGSGRRIKQTVHPSLALAHVSLSRMFIDPVLNAVDVFDLIEQFAPFFLILVYQAL